MIVIDGELVPRRHTIQLPDQSARNAEILRKYRAGGSFLTIGEEYGLSDERIRQIVRAEEKREQAGQLVPAQVETRGPAGTPGRDLARQVAKDAGGVVPRLVKPPVGTPQHVIDSQVPRDAMELILLGVPENTRRTYRAAWNGFRRWCEATARTAEPASEETLLAYLAYLKAYKRSPSTVWVAMSAIRKRHRLGQPPLPWEGGERLTLAIKGYTVARLEAGWRPARAVAARRAHIRAMLDAIAGDSGPRAARDRAMLALLYRAALRRSELCALRISDVEFVDEGLTVHVPMSKTDKSGHGSKRPIRGGGSDPRYDSVLLVDRWVETLRGAGIHQGALMLPVKFGAVLPQPPDYRFSGQSVENAYVRLARLADLRGKTTPHGPRRGFATDARADKYDPLAIARAGGWSPRSQSFLDYMEEGGLWEAENPGSMML